MGSVMAVVDAPSLEHGAGMWQRAKQRFVEQFVPQPADEGFDEDILRWLTWRNPPGAVSAYHDRRICWSTAPRLRRS